MKNNTKVVALILSGFGVVAVIVALVLSFIPWSTTGGANPTSAFRAQKSLDQTAFQYGSSPGARYTGSLTRRYKDNDPVKVEFKDLRVSLSGNVNGKISVNGGEADYTQIGNYFFAKAPQSFWKSVLGSDVQPNVDLAPTDNKWTSAERSLPSLGYALSPIVLSGRIGNGDLVNAPKLGAELSSPNKGTPDARYLPTSDPTIESLGENKVRSGKWEITFNPENKAITHIKGEYNSGANTVVTIDTDVTPLAFDELSPMFSEQRQLTSQLGSVPAPGLSTSNLPTGQLGPVGWRQVGSCTTDACGYDFTVNGSIFLGDDGKSGHVNYGLNISFIVNSRPAGESGGRCTPVVAVGFGKTAVTRCTATNLGAAGQIRPSVSFTYLPFIDYGTDSLNGYIDNNTTATKRQFTMVRTGSKRPEASEYNFDHTGLPSSYAVKKGDYLFDGYGPAGAYLITIGPGYASHVTGSTFDSSWPGTALLKEQMGKQVKAVGDGRIAYYAAEQSTANALTLMAIEGGYSDKVSVYFESPDE